MPEEQKGEQQEVQESGNSENISVEKTESPEGDSAQKVNFETLKQEDSPEKASSIDLIIDVELDVTIELGRTTMAIKDILALGKGSIIELDKLVGDPVDILVNNKLIARGEVVVIDENFAVRVTDIVVSSDRVNGLT